MIKKILLIGDSIRLSYQEFVQKQLYGKAEVVGASDNCKFTKYTLYYINEWISIFGRPDVIHWNNGIWDIYHPIPEMDCVSTPDEYLDNIARIHKEMERTKAKIIWAMTTPVTPGCLNCCDEEVVRYNKIAKDYFKSKGIYINDLYSAINKNTDEYILSDHVHLTKAGIDTATKHVVNAIRESITN